MSSLTNHKKLFMTFIYYVLKYINHIHATSVCKPYVVKFVISLMDVIDNGFGPKCILLNQDRIT